MTKQVFTVTVESPEGVGRLTRTDIKDLELGDPVWWHPLCIYAHDGRNWKEFYVEYWGVSDYVTKDMPGTEYCIIKYYDMHTGEYAIRHTPLYTIQLNKCRGA